MSIPAITITTKGPLLQPDVSSKMKRAIRAGLFDVAGEIAGTVQEQLYLGHGWRTGNLRGSINARQFSDLGYKVSSGLIATQDTQPLIYAYWIETGKRRGRQTRFSGYQMFKNAARYWNANRSRIDKVMQTYISRAF